MSDPREFDLRQIPGVEAVPATGVPESCSPFDAMVAGIASLLGEEPEDIWISRKGVPQVGSFYKFVIPEAIASAVLQLAQERDALREQVARLEEAKDTSIDRYAAVKRDGLMALQEITRLRAALEKYGRHLPFCGHGHCQANPCTCGLAEALKGAE